MKNLLKVGAAAGYGAMHGFHASEGVARVAARMPFVGPAAYLLLRAGSAVAGAGHQAKKVIDSL